MRLSLPLIGVYFISSFPRDTTDSVAHAIIAYLPRQPPAATNAAIVLAETVQGPNLSRFIIQELVIDVSVVTSSRHADRSCARRFAVAKPRFSGRAPHGEGGMWDRVTLGCGGKGPGGGCSPEKMFRI